MNVCREVRGSHWTRPLARTGGILVAVVLAAAQPAAAQTENQPTNHLARETSPYLLLHAHNPVDWRPWGPEAFAKAKAENKPIFLSIGYSSCYWCHVMERESFSDPEVARVMNRNFVCVKVDREERPDVDQIYMAALQAFGTGGWPMSMFLTPDGRPFYGGTYYPPRDRDGFTGFLTVLSGVAKSWREERTEIERAATSLSRVVQRVLETTGPRAKTPPPREVVHEARTRLVQQFDPEYGGFGYNPENPRRPKFPEPANLLFLLDQYRRDARKAERTGEDRTRDAAARRPGTEPLSMALFTMDRMARGGIRDQLGGGYHRYATSRYWIVPHFEKMLYDNALLASAHLAAYELTGDRRWRDEAESTLAFVARSMTAPDGGFFSALDAETEGEEGAYYVWTVDEVRAALGNDPAVESFLQVYGMKREPNFTERRYVLLEPRSRREQAENLKTTPDDLEARLKPLRERLLAVRDRRPAPLRDDKILTAWNGLMIAAYADAARLLESPEHRRTAEKAADFLWSNLRTADGRLLRSRRDGRSRLAGYLEDYAFFVHGLLKLHAATGDPLRLQQARELTDRMIDDFGDSKGGGFFFTADEHESLLARPKDPFDGAVPSANGAAVLNLVALARATGEDRYLNLAEASLRTFSAALRQNPVAAPTMLIGLEAFYDARPAAAPLQSLVQGALTPAPADVVTASARWADGQTAEPGRDLSVRVRIAVKPGWHIQANPSGSEILKPTELTLKPDGAAELVRADYPAGRAAVLDSTGGEKILLYEGDVEIAAVVRFQERPPALRLAVQPCNDRVCLAPVELEIPILDGKPSPPPPSDRSVN